MSNNFKRLVVTIMGGILGYALVSLFYEGDFSLFYNAIPFIVGCVIAFFIISYITNQVKKAKEE